MSETQLTHEVSYFTRHKTRDGCVFEEAVCGRWVGWTACAPAEHEPTCPECRAWLGLQETTEETDNHDWAV